MAKTITKIPASINRFTAKPIARKPNAGLQVMPEFQRSMKNKLPVMRLRWIITPITFLPIQNGFL